MGTATLTPAHGKQGVALEALQLSQTLAVSVAVALTPPAGPRQCAATDALVLHVARRVAEVGVGRAVVVRAAACARAPLHCLRAVALKAQQRSRALGVTVAVAMTLGTRLDCSAAIVTQMRQPWRGIIAVVPGNDVVLTSCRAPWDNLTRVPLEALETPTTVAVYIAVTLAALARSQARAAIAALAVQLRVVVAVVVALDVMGTATLTPAHGKQGVALEALQLSQTLAVSVAVALTPPAGPRLCAATDALVLHVARRVAEVGVGRAVVVRAAACACARAPLHCLRAVALKAQQRSRALGVTVAVAMTLGTRLDCSAAIVTQMRQPWRNCNTRVGHVQDFVRSGTWVTKKLVVGIDCARGFMLTQPVYD
jgi:hypothetical protein